MSQTHPECYGQMMPDLARLEYNEPLKGKAFVALVRSQGLGVQELRMTVDEAGWETCLVCPDYRTCYDLSMAKLVLYRALRDTV
jgi:hypothetical protein